MGRGQAETTTRGWAQVVSKGLPTIGRGKVQGARREGMVSQGRLSKAHRETASYQPRLTSGRGLHRKENGGTVRSSTLMTQGAVSPGVPTRTGEAKERMRPANSLALLLQWEVNNSPANFLALLLQWDVALALMTTWDRKTRERFRSWVAPVPEPVAVGVRGSMVEREEERASRTQGEGDSSREQGGTEEVVLDCGVASTVVEITKSSGEQSEVQGMMSSQGRSMGKGKG
ncbi:hypothetical protein ElyMa_000350000 [Elysia marginata]|uniref:Uncharacterized protein n=1 Tax=Elysia marginata TaxID=1093978 RepID=A0AAV4FEH5_9GAST|nr:hypothetical protein ElyMa_000350000 [Elysia marginata]